MADPQEITSQGDDAQAVARKLTEHLTSVAPPLLNGTASSFEAALAAKQAEVTEWSTGASPLLLITHDTDSPDDFSFEFEVKPVEVESKANRIVVAFIKGTRALDNNLPIGSQLYVCQVHEQAPFQAILGYVRHCFLPFSRALLNTADEKKEDIDVIRSVSARLGDLDVELRRSQQSIDIPPITLEPHPKVKEFVDAQKAAGKTPNVEDLPNGSDASFLNEIHKGLNQWKKQIISVTRQDWDVTSGTTMDEIGFWSAMASRVEDIKAQLKREHIDFSFQLLKRNRRFIATSGFVADSGLEDAEKRVAAHQSLLRDFPIKDLLAASDIKSLISAVERVFTHLKAVKRNDYPLYRVVQLMHTVSRDVTVQLRSVLNSGTLMALNYNDFYKATKPADKLFRTWETNRQAFEDIVRETRRKKKDTSFSMDEVHKPHRDFEEFKTRVQEVRSERRKHHDLEVAITSVLSTDPRQCAEALESIRLAYQNLQGVDVFDTTKQGTEMWQIKLSSYREGIEEVEKSLEATLKALVEEAKKKDSTEMFRVCARFNPLFFLPRIESAIRQDRDVLLATVKNDLQRLEDKFRMRYETSETRKMSELRDVPPVSGAIIWARQIERQLDAYMQRVEDVLGKKWHHQLEAKPLVSKSELFRAKLKVKPRFTEWLQGLKGVKMFKVEDSVFKIATTQQDTKLTVNFDKSTVLLFKEVRTLTRLGMKVPYEIKLAADEAREKYPFAVRLEEVIRIYTRTCKALDDKPELQPLAAVFQKNVQERIAKAVRDNIQWDTQKLKEYVDKLSATAVIFQDEVDALVDLYEAIESNMRKLQVVKPTREALNDVMEELQRTIESFESHGYSNLKSWVDNLDRRIEDVLVTRLREILTFFAQALDHSPVVKQRAQAAVSADEVQVDKDRSTFLDFVMDKAIKHEILFRDQVLHVSPPMESARLYLFQTFQQWLSTIVELPRLRCFWTGKQDEEEQPTFREVMSKIKPAELQKVFDKIEEIVNKAQSFAAEWLHYQALWDMDMDTVLREIGDDMSRWDRLIQDMKRSRTTFDNSDTARFFGPIVVEYGTVQTKVNDKYDYWHKSMLHKFAQKASESITSVQKQLQGARKKLETSNLSFGTTKDIVSSVSLIRDLEIKAVEWKDELEVEKGIEKVLNKQRFIFPEDWLYVERVQSEYSSFDQALDKKRSIMQSEGKNIQAILVREEKDLGVRVNEFNTEWQQKRPTQPDLDHHVVSTTLSTFKTRLDDLQTDLSQLAMAKEVMKMDVKEDKRLDEVDSELKELDEVWNELGKAWNALDDVKRTQFSNLKPIELRRKLTAIQTQLKKLPNFMRSYGAYDHITDTIKRYLDMNGPMVNLASGVLRPKHHKQLLREIGMADVEWRDLTVGDLWQADLLRFKKNIAAIIEQAQGESALEEFLNEIEGIWKHMKLELVDYRQKCFLIKNWDPIFLQLTDHISDLGSMRQSPYFKAFERDANEWEQRLNRAQEMFDIFIDVQRRWVYLEGIFNSSIDVQQQLAYQYKRFKQFDSEFVRLMRDIKRDPGVLDWLNPDRELQSKLEAYAEDLDKIQKALGEYLEKQRSAFPRFYFVGDEDLLEIIGNAKNPLKVQRHLPKMFAGISTLQLSDNGQIILGMRSKEGEEIPFESKIKIAEQPSIHQWLGAVQYQMQFTLASLLERAVKDMTAMGASGSIPEKPFFEWVDKYPAQITLLGAQVRWSERVDAALGGGKESLDAIHSSIEETLKLLADHIVNPDIKTDTRKKYEQLVTEMVHQRDVTRELSHQRINSATDYEWLRQVRFSFNPSAKDVMERLEIRISRATFFYGWEYLGVSERLVQTPLTDRCYLTLCEALHMRMGGNPFGPAGTGKTESVKALGAVLGRFVLVFNCDENFDFQAMGRILIGLCQCGAWGCFDEFNRLEERILSAVSQQILTIQTGLRERSKEITLLNRPVKLNTNMGMFVTMNPGYAGRSNLPDNLKQLFRGIAMIAPDRRLIGQVMLYSQGFRTAEDLAGKVVLLFELCKDQLSNQSHYDFGLRALKSVLRSAGTLKRRSLRGTDDEKKAATEEKHDDAWWLEKEEDILIESVCETLVPKLVLADGELFSTLLTAVFPKATVYAPHMDQLRAEVSKLAKERNLVDESSWMDKVMQLDMIQNIHHGVIMVGPAGTGKSCAWRTLLEAMERLDNVKSESYVIDPKAMSKDELYGTLDPTTLEWTDGVFTSVLRKIIDNVRGESNKRHWIIFDGDVDPEWAENLNSVLDDNMLLTLPNGERLALTPNIRVMFEAKDLNFATPATVSRCGMVWFSEEVVTSKMIMTNMLLDLKTHKPSGLSFGLYARAQNVQVEYVGVLQTYFNTYSAEERGDSSFVQSCLDYVADKDHVMPFDRLRMLSSLFSLLKGGLLKIIEYNDNPVGPPLEGASLRAYAVRFLVMSILWSFAGSLSLKERLEFCEEIHAICPSSIPLPNKHDAPVLDYNVSLKSQDWVLWESGLDRVEMEPHKIVHPDVVIETVDTARHADIVGMWVADHRPAILCGPPGSGKSMTLTSVLRALPSFELVTLNFSSSTTPQLMFKTFDHYCKVERTPNGFRMVPNFKNKWIVIFCDEINLPMNDDYETQMVITFLRQLTEHGGFWRASDPPTFVSLERIQIIGACNPPSDAGRVAMSPRFLRHCPLLFVDFPATASLKMIYGTFNRALLQLVPALSSNADALTNAMVEFYEASQERFTPDMQPHYIYSPRELSRWVRALYEAMKPLESMRIEQLVRLMAHEALRLFQDRLVEEAERKWTNMKIDEVARKHFPQADERAALARPILFSNWLSKQYVSVEQEELREHVVQRLHVFNEEVLDVKLVIFDEVLEHILRIDRVLRQPLGHMLLVGASGAGKTILSKFVSWMNGMSVFQIKVHKMYDTDDFDKDLRGCLLRAGTQQEKICFIFDESNVLDTGFLERMNALLASGEVPGLFENADYKNLMQECQAAARRDGMNIDNEEELYARFCGEVQRNLHVVFTMNPSNEDFDNRSATSPALFNRCVIDWFGEWSHTALEQVGFEFTADIDLGDGTDEPSEHKGMRAAPGSQRAAVVDTLVFVHESVHSAMDDLAKQHAGRATYVTPRHYLDFIKHYHHLINEKIEQLEDQQRHLNTGLKQLKDTEEQVQTLGEQLKVKNKDLAIKTEEAKQKLKQIFDDQRVAERKKEASIKLAEEVKVQEEKINKRKVTVTNELAQAEPALRDAEAAVRGIKKSQLVEVTGFRNPPKLVQLAVEPILIILGHSKHGKAPTWDDARKSLRKPDFIPTILNFNTESITARHRAIIEEKYLSNPDFVFEKVNRASKACGPLVKWLDSQLHYAKVMQSVEPLQQEVKQLTDEAEEAKNKLEELTEMVGQLDTRIKQYVDEYDDLKKEESSIEAEIKDVKSKVDRSSRMITSLSSERTRWEADAKGFKEQMSTVIGDTLVSAAFLAYIGYFNQHFRHKLVAEWQQALRDKNVLVKDGLSIIEYLSHPSERLQWQVDKLPADDLCTENAIMIKRFNRYPLIIDPSGQATEYMMTHFKKNKIKRTSFLDVAFLKNLEAALRFGNALLVEDSESMDPVLNPVLNREITKAGGRVMINIGDKEIDFSPAFTIFLATRDPTVHFTPDLCSRVTFVNFTVTHSSLTAQCLSKVLKSERPDIDRKRTDMIKLQGEYRVRLRHLEESLLNALSEVKGNILEDDKVMNSLENLKSESDEVQQKMVDSDKVLVEVDEVSDVYRTFALHCSRVYFTLEKLSEVHFLYQFSLNFFLELIDDVINDEQVKAIQDPQDRLVALTKNMFWSSFNRVSRSLYVHDHLAFGMRLAQLFLEDSQTALVPEEVDFLMKATAGDSPIADVPAELKLSKAKKMLLSRLFALPAFEGLHDHLKANVKAWTRFHDPFQDKDVLAEFKAKQTDEEKKHLDEDEILFATIPSGWEKHSNNVSTYFHHIMVTKILRPDLLPHCVRRFISEVFGKGFFEQAQGFDLKQVVLHEIAADVPVLMVSAPGYDPSGKVDNLAANLGKKLGKDFFSLAMGSPEGYAQANNAVTDAAKRGYWVLLKNVHLAPVWLSKLEKSLHLQKPHKNFRLFLTMELNLKVPANLVRSSTVLIYEAPVGIKSSLLRTWNSFDRERVDRAPKERSRLYFLLAWLHAVVMERLRYVPVGWSKGFEFSESDLTCAVDAIDEWVDKTAGNRINIKPEQIPWGALQALMETVTYGGRLDNMFDDGRLEAFARWLFCAKAFDADYPLALHHGANGQSDALVTIPDANSYTKFHDWIKELPELKNPEFLGLNSNAELMLLQKHADDITRQLLQLQEEERSKLDIIGAATSRGRKGSNARRGSIADMMKRRQSSMLMVADKDHFQRPTWMVVMAKQVQSWLKRLPSMLKPLERTSQSVKDPLYRALNREVNLFIELLDIVKSDLKKVMAVVEGSEKANNHVRSLFSRFQKDRIPNTWNKYSVEQLPISLWIDDFSMRVENMQKVQAMGPGKYGRKSFWLGGLQTPEAYVAATRQAVAQQNKWSLDELILKVSFEGDAGIPKENTFCVTGMTMFAGKWSNGKLAMSHQVTDSLPSAFLTWVVATDQDKKDLRDDNKFCTLPVYRNSSRKDYLFSIRLPCPDAFPARVWRERGTGITVWNSHM